MRFNIVRMPKEDEQVRTYLQGVAPFLDAMYTQDDEKVHGDLVFAMDYFLFQWDTGGVFFLEYRSDANELVGLALCVQYQDMWSGRNRVEISRYAIENTIEENTFFADIKNYLIGVASLLKFTQLYVHYRDSKGNEAKYLEWNGD